MTSTKTAVITGASRGIGLAIARALAPSYRLILIARDLARLERAADDIARAQTELPTVIAADLMDPAQLGAAIERLQQLDPSPAILINNAGVAVSAPLHATDEAMWSSAVGINLTVPFMVAQACADAMIRQRWGRIINIASTAALKGYRYTAAYSASKAGLVGLTRALAAELSSYGVTVNAICPGFTDTDIVQESVARITAKTGRSHEQARTELERFSPLRRLVQPHEVAAMVAYLCSEAADAVTGQAWAIDGGETTQ